MPATALRCRVCEIHFPPDPVGVCSRRFGPLGALRTAVRNGDVGEDDRVVLLVTGDGRKTPGLVADRLNPVVVAPDSDLILETLGGVR